MVVVVVVSFDAMQQKHSEADSSSPSQKNFPAVAQLVEALRCKPEGRGFDSR
jgi:hypothetical protein